MTQAEYILSRERLEKAAATANLLMEHSVFVNKMVAFRIECLRLIMLADSVLENELNNGWDIEGEERCVLDTLKFSTSEDAVQNPFLASELHQRVTELILPLLEALAIQEES